MSARSFFGRHKGKLVPLLLVALLGTLAFVYGGALRAWFGMKPMASEPGTAAKATAGPLVIEAALAPDPPEQKGNALRLLVKDAGGQPVEGADVAVEYFMPEMGSMPEMRGAADVEEKGDGRYVATFDLPMGGTWTLIAKVTSPAGGGEARYTMTVGTPGLTPVAGGGSGMSGMSAPGGQAPGEGAGDDAPTLPPTELPPPALAALRDGFLAYDEVRALLAKDALAGVGAPARRLAAQIRAATAALPGAPSEVTSCLGQGADAADRLAGAGSLDEARLAFGEVSRFLVALAASDPRLQEGWHVFRCPMAKGYPKWFQRSPKIENPYMGQAMPTCGSRATWDVPPPPEAAGVSHEGHGHEGDDPAFYTCSMHPSVKQKDPGTCPICAMDLTPVTYDEQEGGVVLIDDERRQRIGVKTGRVVSAPLVLPIRAVGRVAIDETQLTDVTLKIAGYVTKLHVSETGQRVKKGQTLFSLYSPELFAAQEEYLLALRGAGGERGSALARAAEKKLELWDLSRAQIRRIAARGKPIEDLPIAAPASGFVVEKNVVEGAAIEAGQLLYRIAALDRIWVEADVYEAELPHVRVGQKAKVTLPYLPGRVLEGRVAYVYPTLDPKTRTAKVRIELPNEGLELKPAMYANVELEADLGKRLLVPVSAVVYTGPRRLVFLDLGEGRLRPQEVELGASTGEFYEVLSGLREGQVVVTSGNFLVAAESRIRSASEYWSDPDATE